MKHTCWVYKTRLEKELLRYDSSHSKMVKRGIAVSCLTQAVRKTCVCGRVNRKQEDDKGSGVKHRQKFVECQKCVVYKILLSYGRAYI